MYSERSGIFVETIDNFLATKYFIVSDQEDIMDELISQKFTFQYKFDSFIYLFLNFIRFQLLFEENSNFASYILFYFHKIFCWNMEAFIFQRILFKR